MIKKLSKLTLVSFLFLGASFIQKDVKAEEISQELPVQKQTNNRFSVQKNYENVHLDVYPDFKLLDKVSAKGAVTVYNSYCNKDSINVLYMVYNDDIVEKNLPPGGSFTYDLTYNQHYNDYEILISSCTAPGNFYLTVEYDPWYYPNI